jgi:hypothetical protein
LDESQTSNNAVKRKAERLCNEERSRKRQAIQGKKMMETFAKNHQLEPGTLVNLTVDLRDRSHCNPLGLMAVVFIVNQQGGFCAVTENGILGSNGQRRWFNFGDYSVLDDDTTTSQDIRNIRESIKNGKFNEKLYKIISMHKAHSIMVGHVANGRLKCSCKEGNCSGRCGCRRAKRKCTSRCTCCGMCNGSNDFESNL